MQLVFLHGKYITRKIIVRLDGHLAYLGSDGQHFPLVRSAREIAKHRQTPHLPTTCTMGRERKNLLPHSTPLSLLLPIVFLSPPRDQPRHHRVSQDRANASSLCHHSSPSSSSIGLGLGAIVGALPNNIASSLQQNGAG
jgi:hypothetical protein